MNPAEQNNAAERDRLQIQMREIVDRTQIETVLARYARGVDRKDESLLRSVYHLDAIDNHGTYNGAADAFVTQLMPRIRAMQVCFHALCKPWIEIEGDKAVVETYFVGFYRLPIPLPDGALKNMYQFGRYLDRFERRQGEWRIAHRQLVIDDTRLEDAPDAGVIAAMAKMYRVGADAPADYVYELWSELEAR